MMRNLLVAAVTFAALLTVVAVASADHSWSVYHWPSDSLSPTVVDKTSSSLYDVPLGVTEWANLGTPIQPTPTDANKGDITVTEAFSPFWLGLARIFIDENGHITKGEVKLNTRLLNSYGPVAADHVLCQEIGHVLGLGHNRVGDSSPEDETCMNDQLLGFPAPNQHDTDQLNLIYDGHIDTTADSTTDNGGPDCEKNTNAKQCRSGNGFWITVHVFPLP